MNVSYKYKIMDFEKINMLRILILLGVFVWNEAIPVCPAVDGRNAVYIAHETNCAKFYQCSNGIPYLFDCPVGLEFNPTLNVCDWPWAAGCQTSSTSAPTTSEPDSTEELDSTEEPDSTEDPNSSDKSSDSSSSSSESKSSSSSESDSSENDSEEIVSLRLQAKCSNLENVYMTSHPKYQKKYVICYFGDPIIKECPADFSYDSDIQICVRKIIDSV